MERLTRQAEAVLRSQDPPIHDSYVPLLAHQLASRVSMQSQREKMASPFVRCKSVDPSLQLHEIYGHAFQFSMDEQGSKFLEARLCYATDEEKDVIFEEIRHFAPYLATHVYGYRVVQKFFQFGSEVQRSELGDMIFKDVDKLALHVYGCRVIQMALEVPSMDERLSIAREIEPYVPLCAHNQYGREVILKIINCVPQELLGFFISALAADVVFLSTHPGAYRIIERVLEVDVEESPERVMMISNILEGMHTLSFDEFGHNIVQVVLDKGKPHERTAVIQRLSGHLIQMSMHPFASRVVEKSLLAGEPHQKRLLANEILSIADNCDVDLQPMMSEKLANFQRVVQICRSYMHARASTLDADDGKIM